MLINHKRKWNLRHKWTNKKKVKLHNGIITYLKRYFLNIKWLISKKNIKITIFKIKLLKNKILSYQIKKLI